MHQYDFCSTIILFRSDLIFFTVEMYFLLIYLLVVILLIIKMEEDDLQCLGGRSKMENPNFRKEVMDILRRPYNKEEYKKLRQDVKSRKPMEGHLELRGRTKRFHKDTMGKSYLDHYFGM